MADPIDNTPQEGQSAGDGAEFNTLEMGADPPIEERLAYDQPLHQKIITRLVARRDLSIRGMGNRTDDWERVDEHCRLFIDLSRPARKADGSTDTTKKEMPFERAIVIPLSYAILWADLTQILGIFLRRDPPMEISGTGPDDMQPAQIMNSVIARDQVQSNYVLHLFQVLQDLLKYGRGTFYDTFEEEYGWKWKDTTLPQIAWPLVRLLKKGWKPRDKHWEPVRSYNMAAAVDPYLWLQDPRVSLSNIQQGEYCGHDDFRGYLYLVERTKENGGPYFNVEHVPTATAGGSTRQQTAPVRNRFTTQNLVLERSADEKDKGFHQVTHMQVKLVPADWELGDGTQPEIWWFSWVDNTVIIRAHESKYEHGQFTYSAGESNPDIHVSDNPGSIELQDGFNRVMNWGFNSHIENIRRFLNNSMIYLPSFVEEADVLNPDAAGHVRGTALLEQMVTEGRMTIDQAIHQMQLTDVTTTWIQNINFMLDMSLRMAGVGDAAQGRVTKDRRTLGEIQEVAAGSSARMALHAALFDVQAIRPLALRWIANRQQFTTAAQYYRITGDLQRLMRAQQLLVKPQDIQGNFDYIPKTGPTPRDPESQYEAWKVVSDTIAGSPVLQGPRPTDGKMLDMHALFEEGVTRSVGIRNLESYYYDPRAAMNAQIVPDANIDEETRKGNMVAAGNGGGP